MFVFLYVFLLPSFSVSINVFFFCAGVFPCTRVRTAAATTCFYGMLAFFTLLLSYPIFVFCSVYDVSFYISRVIGQSTITGVYS